MKKRKKLGLKKAATEQYNFTVVGYQRRYHAGLKGIAKQSSGRRKSNKRDLSLSQLPADDNGARYQESDMLVVYGQAIGEAPHGVRRIMLHFTVSHIPPKRKLKKLALLGTVGLKDHTLTAHIVVPITPSHPAITLADNNIYKALQIETTGLGTGCATLVSYGFRAKGKAIA